MSGRILKKHELGMIHTGVRNRSHPLLQWHTIAFHFHVGKDRQRVQVCSDLWATVIPVTVVMRRELR
jgi:hypothetical protein